MNREILFRGKRVDNGEWVYGDLANETSGIFIRWIYKPSSSPFSFRNFKDMVIPETVGQFTGLMDKNGTKIFEGDLLHRHMNIHWVVKFKQSTWIADSPTDNFGLYLSASQFKDTTITGNIHDNPTPQLSS